MPTGHCAFGSPAVIFTSKAQHYQTAQTGHMGNAAHVKSPRAFAVFPGFAHKVLEHSTLVLTFNRTSCFCSQYDAQRP